MLETLRITRLWPSIKASILLSYPPELPDREDVMSNIMQALLAGRMHAWMLMEDTGEGHKIFGFITTSVATDALSGAKSLYIYTAGAIQPVPLKATRYAIKKLMYIAKRIGCDSITARSDNERFIKLLERYGFNSKVRQLTRSL